jgi:hypothetical protein
MKTPRLIALALVLALTMPALLSAAGSQAVAPQTAPQKAPATAAVKVKTPPTPETVHPAYASLREKTAVLVFLAWLWLIVGVLAYLLRLKIREADRVYGLKYFPVSKDAPRPPAH